MVVLMSGGGWNRTHEENGRYRVDQRGQVRQQHKGVRFVNASFLSINAIQVSPRVSLARSRAKVKSKFNCCLRWAF